MICADVKPLLSAYLDGELDVARRSAIDSHTRECPSCATHFSDMESLRQTLRIEMPYYRAPGELRERVRFALRGAAHLDRPGPRRRWQLWTAVAAALLALTAAPFLVNARSQRRMVTEEILSAHQRSLLGRSMDVISSDRHNVKPWFNGRVPFSPPVLNLAANGFPLEGARVDYINGHPVAVLVYSRRLHRIDVFIWPAGGQNKPLLQFNRDGYYENSWTADSFLFTAVSDLNQAEFTGFCNLLQGNGPG